MRLTMPSRSNVVLAEDPVESGASDALPTGTEHHEAASRAAGLDARVSTPSTLPEDVLIEQSARIQLFYALGVVLWTITLAMDFGLSPIEHASRDRLLIGLGAAALAAITSLFMRYSPLRLETKITLAGVGIVPHALALALFNASALQPGLVRAVSPTIVLILFFGMMAPARPKKILITSLAAAAMDPIGIWIASLRGQTVPSLPQAIVMFYPSYVCAFLSIVPACIVQGLGRKLREARVFGSYTLIERLGRGGMGEVWRAKHALLTRHAAIKLVRPERLGVDRNHADLILQRFTREAQATAALTSPHTIRVYDFGLTSEGTFYYVMELLDGLDLESLVRQSGPLPPARAMHLVQQICQSLAEAHASGLIHRDIKPANIFVGSSGLEYDFVKVLDFGLVKTDGAAGSTLHTAPAVALGTPGYMAPETIVGSPTPDAGIDVYAIGCVAYYLLTGQLVFTGDSPMHVLLQHVQDEPVPPSVRTEQRVPAEIDTLVMACLRKDPAARPRSALDVLRLVSEVVERHPWKQTVARRWWTEHLPQSAPAAIALGEAVTL